MNTLMIRNAIGKDLTVVKKIVTKDEDLYNVLASMLTYTESEYKSRSDFQKGMIELSQQIDKAIKIWSK